jgi:hypothetical protein
MMTRETEMVRDTGSGLAFYEIRRDTGSGLVFCL